MFLRKRILEPKQRRLDSMGVINMCLGRWKVVIRGTKLVSSVDVFKPSCRVGIWNASPEVKKVNRVNLY